MRNQPIAAERVLQPDEVAKVLADLRPRAARNPEAFARLVVFRLVCCCGLSPTEISELNIEGVRLTAEPHLDLLNTKNGEPRTVPVSWDDDTIADLTTWRIIRTGRRATNADPFVCSLREATYGRRLNRHQVYRRWRAALRCLGNRGHELSCHAGRHTFVSAAIAAGLDATVVQEAAGHQSAATTSRYTNTWGRDGSRAPIFRAIKLEALTHEQQAT